MVEYAGIDGVAAVKEFTSDLKQQESILYYLCEVPIGDEYNYLNDEDWRLGREFEDWAEEKGIDIWVNRYNDPRDGPSPEHRAMDQEVNRVRDLLGENAR